MNDNAGQLGFTKAALYKDYSSKQGILDKIVEQMNRMDYECDAEYEMPETEPDGFAEALKLCNKHGESQVMIDEIYPYNKRKHRQGAYLLRHVRQAGSCKKEWLKQRFDEGLVFYRSEERGKCFIEYIQRKRMGTIEAGGWLYINCLWVSGSMKGHGYSSELLSECIRDAKEQGKKGICILLRRGTETGIFS